MELRHHPAVAGRGKRDMYNVDPRELQIIPGYNVRDMTAPDTLKWIESLKLSIVERGVQEPLVIRFDGTNVLLIKGHCRHAAALKAIAEGHTIETVPAYQELRGTEAADRDADLIIGNSGKPLKPLEVAEAIYRLRKHGWSEEKIAAHCGWKSVASVKNYLDMRGMPEEVKEQVRADDISATLALKVTKDARKDARDDPDFAAKLIRDMKEENRRAGVGRRSKVTPKTVSRAAKAGKLPIPPRAARGQQQAEPTNEAPPQQTAEEAPGAAPASAAAPMSAASEALRETFAPQPASPLNGTKDLIEAAQPFFESAAQIILDGRLDGHDDADTFVVRFSVFDLKRAAAAHAHAVEAVS